MSSVRIGEAVAIAIEPSGDGFKELAVEDFKENPLKLVMGKLKAQKNDMYTVDILNNWYGIHGEAEVKQSFLWVPVECIVSNALGVEVTAYGVIKWGANLNGAELEAYTDRGIKEVVCGKIKRIKLWN